MIRLENIYYSYDKTPAIRGITTQIGEGITYLLGPNGSGKTTLMKIMSALLKPQRGQINVLGIDPWANKKNLEKTWKQVVYVHEEPILFRGTGLHNLEMALRLRGASREEAIRMVREFVAEKPFMRFLEKKRRELSYGQRKIVSLLRALILKPRILLLDEPTNGLDIENRRLILEELRTMVRSGDIQTLIIATHDLLLPLQLQGKINYQENGRIIRVLSVDELKREYLKL